MNLHSKINKATADIKSVEGQATELVKNGSKNQSHYMDMVYYSGVLNGFSFMYHVLTHPLSEIEFDELFKQMMHFEKAN